MDKVAVENVSQWEAKFHRYLDLQHKKLLEKVSTIKDFSEIEEDLKKAQEEQQTVKEGEKS